MDINTQSHKKVFLFGRIIIFATAALVAVLQANEAVAASENARLIESIVMAAACIGIISFCAAGAIRKSLKDLISRDTFEMCRKVREQGYLVIVDPSILFRI